MTPNAGAAWKDWRMLYPTHAEIDLAAIRDNLLGVRGRVGSVAVLVCVKANAYGHGAVDVARYLQNQRLADGLGVATVPEAIELREAGITLPLLKLSHAFPEEIPAALAINLELPVVDVAGIDAVDQAAWDADLVARVHLAVDTGMRRIGCEPDQAAALAARIAASAHVDLAGVFTHLPISDAAEGTAYTRAELALFESVVAQIQADRAAAGLAAVPLIHAANSGAVLGHDLGSATLVRPGIMAYGYYPDATSVRSIALRPALSMRSRVSQVKKIRAGETVGYGRTWTAPMDTWIATVSVGYADGYSRLNSNRGRMLINGRSYPVAGRVCMDQTMLDLGPHNSHGVGAGDSVTIIGVDGAESITADELAELMGTISYELTCLITPRVTRVFTTGQAAD